MMPEFQKCLRNSETQLWGEWRLASVEETKKYMSDDIKGKVLYSTDTSRLLDGCVKETYRVLKQYSPNLKYMLLIKKSEFKKSDGLFDPKVYSEVTWTAQGRKAAILLSCENKITDVICSVLHNMAENVESGKREEELDRLTESLNEKFGNGRTVLHYAADQLLNPNHATYIAELIEKKFDNGKELIKAEDKYGMTALHFAAFRGNTELCRFLVEKCGLDVKKGDKNGENVLHFAVKGKIANLSKDLNGLPGENVFKDLYALPGVKEIIGSVDAQKRTALHKAAAQGCTDIINILLSSISNYREIYICQADLFGQTALLEAVRGGHEETVKLLLENGSNPLRERDFDGKSALHYAVQLSDDVKTERMVDLLLEHYKSESEEERSLLLWASAAGIGTADEYLKTKTQEVEQRNELLGPAYVRVGELLRKERECSAERLDDLFISAIEHRHENVARELVKRGVNAARVKKRIPSENKQRVDKRMLHSKTNSPL